MNQKKSLPLYIRDLHKLLDGDLITLDRGNSLQIMRDQSLIPLCGDTLLTGYDSSNAAEIEFMARRIKHVFREGKEYTLYMDEKSGFISNYYFTFGSALFFPYPNSYLVVKADTMDSAIRKFRRKYPDRMKDVYNASECYTEIEWNGKSDHYYNFPPAEIIE